MLRFGTDGVRGLANAELTPEYVMALGRAAGRVLASVGTDPSGDSGGRARLERAWRRRLSEPSRLIVERPAGRHRRFIVGRDTRLSSSLLQAALSAGLAGEGIDVVDAGIIATPAVAYLSAEQQAPAAVISASHNPFWDNGVKFFSAGGSKLPDETEEALEAELAALVRPAGAALGAHPRRYRADRAGPGARWGGTSGTCSRACRGGAWTACGWRSIAPTELLSRAHRQCSRRPAHNLSPCSPSSPTARTSTTSVVPPTPASSSRPSNLKGPTSGWPSMATPTASSPSTPLGA